ncbi:MAG: SMP-30/gluconolactonase/LRE family protein [Anaerolineales bacterium]
MSATPIPLNDVTMLLGEGPRWWSDSATLTWLDVTNGLAFRAALNEPPSVWDVGERVSFLAEKLGGGWILALGGDIGVTDSWGARPTSRISVVDSSDGLVLNDGIVDRRGCIWVGSADLSGASRGGVFLIEGDFAVSKQIEGLSMANGIAFSSDGAEIYVVDTDRGTIDSYKLTAESDRLRERNTIVRIDPDVGKPDGITVDIHGSIWVAIWGGGVVQRYSADGSFLGQIQLPVDNVSACTFGGKGLSKMFVTTAMRAPLKDPPTTSQFGRIFEVTPGSSGFPASRFGG